VPWPFAPHRLQEQQQQQQGQQGGGANGAIEMQGWMQQGAPWQLPPSAGSRPPPQQQQQQQWNNWPQQGDTSSIKSANPFLS